MILLTGVNGFIGSHIFEYLRKKDIPCVGISFKEYCSSNKIDFTGLSNVDTLVICSGLAHDSNNSDQSMIGLYLDINVFKLISFCKQVKQYSRLKRIVFLSSINVNSYDSGNLPSYFVDNNALSKFIFENILKEFGIVNDIEITIIRSPLVYGKGVKANFARLLNIIKKGLPLPLGAINYNKRSFVSLYNLTDLVVKCVNHYKAAGQTFLVSDDYDLSTTAMVNMMAKVQGVKPCLLPVPVLILNFLGKITGKSDIISRLTDSLQVDISHTKETLGWIPPYSVEEGFAKCIQKSSH